MSQEAPAFDVAIVVPVLNKIEFTRQCLDRIWRNTGTSVSYEVIIVDNGSSDGTAEWFASGGGGLPRPIRYHRHDQNVGFARGNNAGAELARGEYLLFLNNDTLVQPEWLTEMVRVARSDQSVGVVGIKQLFPYTNTIYHTGIVFAPGGVPQHLYPHLDASLPQVNKEREYQAVTGACLLIDRALFRACGGFDEGYVNGYEDIDLCLEVRRRGRKVVCCTSAYIYHYGQISEGRTAADDQNAARFASKWGNRVRVDRDDYLVRDGVSAPRTPKRAAPAIRSLADDCVYLADDLGQGNAFTWVNVELARSLAGLGVPVFVRGGRISPTVPATARRQVAGLALADAPVGGVQIKWSHYWPQHLNLELNGTTNLEFFVVNYLFGRAGDEPWDYWLQCVRQNHRDKLALADFCKSVLQQVGIPDERIHVLPLGYSREVHEVAPPLRRDARFRFLTVTNSHDLGRYGTVKLLDAYQQAFAANEAVTLVVKDYGASSGDHTIREWLGSRHGGAAIEYVTAFTDKRKLIELYKSCDAFVSAHRGEGFGMKILDALACGLSVITPLFGGPTAFCSAETCYPVDFSLVPVKDCIDARSLPIANQPMWAEPAIASLARQMRTVFEERKAGAELAARTQAHVLKRFSWDTVAKDLINITARVRSRRIGSPRAATSDHVIKAETSPYWLGMRISVVIPTHNRKDKLLACVRSLGRQSVLPQEFEVLVIDDGSTDGTREALDSVTLPFHVRYFRQESQGPGSARNLGIEQATGELVLFIGDDIVADERLLEEHLLAHAPHPDPGVAFLGHIDWPASLPKNEVMEFVCGDAALQFAYTLIPRLPSLDHRFFYTSNISLKRRFLTEAADAGIRFDPCFRHAAFEDSELAFRLLPRGLEIRYAPNARAVHDHGMDLASFSEREFRAGQMAVVFYRKHPGHDDHLQVQWLGTLNETVSGLMKQPEVLRDLEELDRQTDAALHATAQSLERLLSIQRLSTADRLPTDRIRSGLHRTLKTIFDVARTRGKVLEWHANVQDASRIQTAQALASVLRKVDYLDGPWRDAGSDLSPGISDGRLLATLTGTSTPSPTHKRAGRPTWVRIPLGFRAWRSTLAAPWLVSRLRRADRRIQVRLSGPGRRAWLERYRKLRARMRRVLG